MSEFDRKKSTKSVGELYPVLLSKDGKVIDGLHRLEDNPDWRTETLEHIDSEEKLLLARTISNWHRRAIPIKEKEEWINGLAKIYQEQGIAEGRLANKIAKETGLTTKTVGEYLHDDYKLTSMARIGPRPQIRVPASQRIETELGIDYVERHEAEVLEKALTDPKFIAKAIKKEKTSKILSEIKRLPIQLSLKVKQKFDDIHDILKQETQSETVELLIDFYRANGMKVQV